MSNLTSNSWAGDAVIKGILRFPRRDRPIQTAGDTGAGSVSCNQRIGLAVSGAFSERLAIADVNLLEFISNDDQIMPE
jgi:hypothetical protein